MLLGVSVAAPGSASDDFGRFVKLETLTKPGFRCDSADYFADARYLSFAARDQARLRGDDTN
ncbi:hypothetical protein DL991_40325 [Amycolatopsis sp. WAC 01375]|uniref:hypothetical protein n=1 Tax=Amycolatopsis sp. WAC 01375 TaxID=2203194 RepID=UPI000F7A5238|nr:hypothetical protein [Amycolatopsis sp. WAC 01375]RSM69387.1 hypothetical protein DL991_40325 [Amycolatopsis sp. WAC 01375]